MLPFTKCRWLPLLVMLWAANLPIQGSLSAKPNNGSDWPLGGARGQPKQRPEPQQPNFCLNTPHAGAVRATSMSAAGNMVKVYDNIFFHNKKWFGLVDSSRASSQITDAPGTSISNSGREASRSTSSSDAGGTISGSSSCSSSSVLGNSSSSSEGSQVDRGMSINTDIVLLPTSDVATFTKNLKVNCQHCSILMAFASHLHLPRPLGFCNQQTWAATR